MKKRYVRWPLTLLLIVLIWFDVKWALFWAVTILIINSEAIAYLEELKGETEVDAKKLAEDLYELRRKR